VHSLPTDYQKFIHLSRYSRWQDELERRETWEETVARYFGFFRKQLNGKVNSKLDDMLKECQEGVLNLEVVPSMRALMTAGKAAEKDHVAIYNCAYSPIDNPQVFDEAMYILMCSTGMGFSVERRYTDKLPEIPKKFYPTNTTIVVEDSKIGWATSFRELISFLYMGKIPKWDLSKLRPAGARLKTFGGRSSGPGPLNDLFEFTVEQFKKAANRKLASLECHDLMCMTASIVEVGGVRRAATISLSDLEDERMRMAKTGKWFDTNGYRHIANNSAVYEEKPDIGVFMSEWKSLYDSKSGERGIFNREAAKRAAGRSGRRNIEFEFGCNPCSEIILRPKEFCNLSEVVVRENDTPSTIIRKVKLATILGTIQATCTNFRYISDEWKRNCEEERLLGVSFTGIYDNVMMYGRDKENPLQDVLTKFRQEALEVNVEISAMLGINPATAIGCIKPSGNTSQLVNSASGIGQRHSPYYIRTVRNSKQDPVSLMMRDKGFPAEDALTNPTKTDVFSFPIKSPEDSVFRNEVSAIDHLKLWMVYQKNWCEHKPSTTIYIKENEWMDVGAFVYKNFDDVSGVAFLPYDGGNYKQAPYQEISEQEYLDFCAKMPMGVDWNKLPEYEKDDMTENTKEYACTSGQCEI
jgi:ribonucleoside-triphosphate reductase (thioredoxin)